MKRLTKRGDMGRIRQERETSSYRDEPSSSNDLSCSVVGSGNAPSLYKFGSFTNRTGIFPAYHLPRVIPGGQEFRTVGNAPILLNGKIPPRPDHLASLGIPEKGKTCVTSVTASGTAVHQRLGVWECKLYPVLKALTHPILTSCRDISLAIGEVSLSTSPKPAKPV